MKNPLNQIMKLPYFCSNLPSLQMVCKAKLLVQVLILCITITTLFASESADSEILGPESGVVDLRYRPDNKVVALTAECKFDSDKAEYNVGDLVRVKYYIKVDTQSRGYKPNRNYCIVSQYNTGYQIKAGKSLYWHVLKTDLDTLVIIDDKQSISGVIMLELISHNSNYKTTTDNEPYFMYSQPGDTLAYQKGSHGRPPIISLDTFRIALAETCQNAIKHISGSFSFDQMGVIHFYGDSNSEWFNRKLNKAKGTISDKN